MLIRFEASNYRSIAAAVELSMVAIDRDRVEARSQPMLGESLLPIAAVFGPNASGKSNIISAYAWLRDAVEYSLRNWGEDIPVEPFAFGDGVAKPSYFVVEYMIDDVRFEYALEVDGEKVFYEALFHYPEKKRRRIFEREGEDLKIQRGLGGISGTRELLTKQTLVLSVARRFDEPLVTKFARKLSQTQTMGISQQRSRKSIFSANQSTNRWFSDVGKGLEFADRNQALALLRLADLGIDDVLINTEEMSLTGDPTENYTRTRIRFLHRTESGNIPLDINAESDGTRTWFRLIGPVLTALHRGSLLLFDELDASLHPTLSAQLVQLFHDPVTNPEGAQLVFTSHDTSLLNHLNRDEVWLTEKRADGSTRLGALSEFAGERVRKSQNLETAYLHGRFGALPQVDQADFLRALGLIG